MSIHGITNNGYVADITTDISMKSKMQQNNATGTASSVAPNAFINDVVSITNSMSLASTSPKVQELLHNIAEQGGDVLGTLDKNVSTLQDSFLDSFVALTNSVGISTQEKITLTSVNETIQLGAQHPQGEAIEELLAATPELSDAFNEIAIQSELARNIRNIRGVVTQHIGHTAYAETAKGVNAPYQFSIKGEMSHFYFGR